MAPLLASISAFLSAWRWCSFCGTWASEAAAVGTALVVAIPQSKSARWFFIRSTAPAWYLLSRCLPALCRNAELASPPLDSKPHVRHRSDCDTSSNEKDSTLRRTRRTRGALLRFVLQASGAGLR